MRGSEGHPFVLRRAQHERDFEVRLSATNTTVRPEPVEGRPQSRWKFSALLPALLLAACGEAPEPPGPSGAALYAEHCLVCHQTDGGGVPYMQPALAGSARANGPVGDLAAFVLAGSAALAPSERQFDNEMPGFDFLDDTELAALLTHIRTHFGNKSSKVTAAEVAAARGRN